MLSEIAQKIWTRGVPTIMEDIINRGFKTTLLDTEYRMPWPLYKHISDVIYDGKVHAYQRYHEETEMFQNLKARLPIRVGTTAGHVAHVDGWARFIDVDGKCESLPQGSSYNSDEIVACRNLVTGLTRQNKIKGHPHCRDILILTGYQWMLIELQKDARVMGWDGAGEGKIQMKFIGPGVKTIDASQGAEAPIIIVCCVRTDTHLGFLRQKSRANVALSRQMMALYVIGKWDFVIQGAGLDQQKRNWLGALLLALRSNIPNFVVRSLPVQTLAQAQKRPGSSSGPSQGASQAPRLH